MALRLSSELEDRLEKIAQQQSCSVEELLSHYADEVEQTLISPHVMQFLESSVAGICMADMEGNFLYVNPSFKRMLGYDDEELLSQPYKSFVHPDDYDATTSAEEQLKTGEPVIQFENRYRRHDGTYRWLSWASTVYDSHIYAIALDVTKHKQTERQLAEALKYR